MTYNCERLTVFKANADLCGLHCSQVLDCHLQDLRLLQLAGSLWAPETRMRALSVRHRVCSCTSVRSCVAVPSRLSVRPSNTRLLSVGLYARARRHMIVHVRRQHLSQTLPTSYHHLMMEDYLPLTQAINECVTDCSDVIKRVTTTQSHVTSRWDCFTPPPSPTFPPASRH